MMGIHSPTQAEWWQHGILRLIAGGDGSFCVFLCGRGGWGINKDLVNFQEVQCAIVGSNFDKVVFVSCFFAGLFSSNTWSVYSGLGIANLNWNCISSTTHRIHGKNGIFTYMMHFFLGSDQCRYRYTYKMPMDQPWIVAALYLFGALESLRGQALFCPQIIFYTTEL